MNGEERRGEILKLIGAEPLSAASIAEKFGVSRQVIVQDIALIRANGRPIIATNRGYILGSAMRCERVFKVRHSDEETGEELNWIVDCGGTAEDVFVHHKVYGKIRVDLRIGSRSQVEDLIRKIESGKSTPLKKITSDYHYHTVSADGEEILDQIEDGLRARGFLIPGRKKS